MDADDMVDPSEDRRISGIPVTEQCARVALLGPRPTDTLLVWHP
jgi:hypothetical protein